MEYIYHLSGTTASLHLHRLPERCDSRDLCHNQSESIKTAAIRGISRIAPAFARASRLTQHARQLLPTARSTLVIRSMASETQNASRGAFIVFEGGDRCGKSTQCKLLVDHLKSTGVHVLPPAPQDPPPPPNPPTPTPNTPREEECGRLPMGDLPVLVLRKRSRGEMAVNRSSNTHQAPERDSWLLTGHLCEPLKQCASIPRGSVVAADSSHPLARWRSSSGISPIGARRSGT